MWLLNHAEEVQQALPHPRLRKSGPAVQQALFLAWNAANRICAKRLIPILPTLIEALERMSLLLLNGTTNLSTLGLSNAKIARGVGSWQAVSISIIVLAVITFASVLGLREGTRAAITNPDAHTYTESAVILAAQDEWGACIRSNE